MSLSLSHSVPSQKLKGILVKPDQETLPNLRARIYGCVHLLLAAPPHKAKWNGILYDPFAPFLLNLLPIEESPSPPPTPTPLYLTSTHNGKPNKKTSNWFFLIIEKKKTQTHTQTEGVEVGVLLLFCSTWVCVHCLSSDVAFVATLLVLSQWPKWIHFQEQEQRNELPLVSITFWCQVIETTQLIFW